MWLPPPQGQAEMCKNGYHHRKGKMWKSCVEVDWQLVELVEGDVESCKIKLLCVESEKIKIEFGGATKG